MWRSGRVLVLAIGLACGSAAADDLGVRGFDLGNAQTPAAGEELVKLQCFGNDKHGTIYVTNVAIDRARRTVWAYIPVLKVGLQFTDGRSGDAQYGENRVELPDLDQHVSINGNKVTIVNKMSTGVKSTTVYDLANHTATATNNVKPVADSNTYGCTRLQ